MTTQPDVRPEDSPGVTAALASWRYLWAASSPSKAEAMIIGSLNS